MFRFVVDMDKLLMVLAWAVGAYLVGSINLSILVTRIFGLEDPRESGSGNPGVTNLVRSAGWRAAVPVLVAELAKAYGVVWAAKMLGPANIAPAFALPFLLGNLFPLFHRFRGGKGVAAVVGSMLAIAPLTMLAGGGVFLAVFGIWRRVSAGSIAMVISYPAWIFLFRGTQNVLMTACAMTVVVTITHRANIGRLIRGQEPRLGGKTGESP